MRLIDDLDSVPVQDCQASVRYGRTYILQQQTRLRLGNWGTPELDGFYLEMDAN